MRDAPAFDLPPHVLGPDGLRSWYTEPPGVVVQLERSVRGTKEMAEWLVGPGFTMLRRRFAAVPQVIFVMDLSLMTGRDPAARAIMMAHARECSKYFSHTFIIAPLVTNPVYMTTLYAAAALLRSLGFQVEIAKSLDDVIRRCGLRPAKLR